MRAVYKYPVGLDRFKITLPKEADFLHVGPQTNEWGEKPYMWLDIDTEKGTEEVEFVLVGTGHPIEEGENETFAYCGSFFMYEGSLVFHLYRVYTD